jgi:hypothetical protein
MKKSFLNYKLCRYFLVFTLIILFHAGNSIAIPLTNEIVSWKIPSLDGVFIPYASFKKNNVNVTWATNYFLTADEFDDGGTLPVFCVEDQPADPNARDYELGPLPEELETASELASFFFYRKFKDPSTANNPERRIQINEYWHMVTQIAIWELLFETPGKNLNITKGDFQIIDDSFYFHFSDVIESIEGWYEIDTLQIINRIAKQNSDRWKGNNGSISLAASPTSQDYMTPVAHTPEPSTAVLLGSGLFGLAWLGRRKRRKIRK